MFLDIFVFEIAFMKLSTVFTRLTPNENKWQKPSGRGGKCRAADSTKPLYEEVNHFGWEEWLFEDYHAGKEICLGFLQAFNDKNKHITSVDIIHLYTRICNGNEPRQFYVGYIKDVKVLPQNQRAVTTQQKEQKQKDLKDAKIANFPDNDPMWKKCFNIQFERKNVELLKNDERFEIQLNRGQFRFSLYDINIHPNFLIQIQ
jgi:hypothetical protein